MASAVRAGIDDASIQTIGRAAAAAKTCHCLHKLCV
jgi:hypothetical protein